MPRNPERASTGRAALGQALRRRRTEVGRSLAEVSVDAGLSPFTVNAYERGLRLPPLDVLDDLAVALGTSVRDLLTGVYPYDDRGVRSQ